MDDGLINVSTDHGESYTYAQKETAVALPVFIVRLSYVTSTHTAIPMFPDRDTVTQ